MVTLCVLFNHPYPPNIAALRELYAPRFSDVMFIHLDDEHIEPNVYNSYRAGYNFQGLIADNSQAFMDRKSDLYVFVHDDVMLNPLINEENVRSKLKVSTNGAFLPGFNPIHGSVNRPGDRGWNWIVGALWKLMNPSNTVSGSGLRNLWRDMPKLAKTREQLGAKYGFSFDKLYYDPASPLPQAFGFNDPRRDEQLVKLIFEDLFDHTATPPSLELPMPVFGGLSDLFAVDGSIMSQVLHGFGLMAAANIFVEVAIPTILLNVADYVTQLHDVEFRSDWGFQRERMPVREVVDGFRSDMLAYHPVKLSMDLGYVQSVYSMMEQ